MASALVVRPRMLIVVGLILALVIPVMSAAAVAPAPPHFERTWARTDRPVAEGQAIRTWLWGEEANTEVLTESYAEAPSGERDVQYFDKSRMEITNPSGDPNSVWFVTNGLLVNELISGEMQTGDETFVEKQPAIVNVAGDPNDPNGPTYETMASVLDRTAAAPGAPLIERIDRAGNVTTDQALTGQNVVAGEYVPDTNHTVAQPFWEFMNSSGTVWVDGQFLNELLFLNAFFATGFPVTEAYWAPVLVGGEEKFVLLQCFERRCLTYTPSNSPNWQVEAGNVGQHYFTWRYEQSGESVTTRVLAASGGTVGLGSGAAVEIPPGALNQDTDVTVRSVGEQNLPPSPLGSGSAGQGVDIDLGGAQLSQPATIRVPYRAGDVSPEEVSRLALLHYNEASGQWEPQPMNLDREAGHMVAQVQTFSLFAPFLLPPDEPTTPAAPSNLGAQATGQTTIRLTWQDNAGNESGFDVEYSTDDSVSWMDLGTASPDVTIFDISGLQPGTHYCFRVRASNAQGPSNWSNTACATTDVNQSVPAAPTNLTAELTSPSTAQLTWQDNADNETGFEIEYSVDGGTTWTPFDPFEPNVIGAEVTGMQPNTHYCFRVRAVNAQGPSGWSNTACVTTEPDQSIPAVPTNLVAALVDDSTAELTWNDNSNNEEGFNFYFSIDGSPFQALGGDPCGVDCNIYYVINLEQNTQYCFYVTAHNQYGESPPSNTACVTPSTISAAPVFHFRLAAST